MVYKNLVSIRVNQDKKAKQVAEALGVSLSRYYYLERNPGQLSVERLEQLAKFFAIKTSDVYFTIRRQLSEEPE